MPNAQCPMPNSHISKLLYQSPDFAVAGHDEGDAVSSSALCSVRDILYGPFSGFLIDNKQIVGCGAFLNSIYFIQNETPSRLSFWYAPNFIRIDRNGTSYL